MSRAWVFYLVLIIALGATLGYLQYQRTSPLSLDASSSSEYVTFSISAHGSPAGTSESASTPDSSSAGGSTDAAETLASITATRIPGILRDLTITVPAGSLIMNGDVGGQRLMTSNSVELELKHGESTVTVQVTLYCLDQFALPPTRQSSLSFNFGSEGDSDFKENEPVRKLAQCLEGLTESHAWKDIAVWFVSSDYVDKTYADVRTDLIHKTTAALGPQIDVALQGPIVSILKAKYPNLSDDRITAAIDTYRQTRLEAKIDSQAGALADQTLLGFRNRGSGMLDSCGYDTAKLAFFTTAP